MSKGVILPRSDSSGIPVGSARFDKPEGRVIGSDNLATMVVKLAVAEFIAVAGAAYLTSLFYYFFVLEHLPPTLAYVSSALLIAGLVLLFSLSFRHYVMLQTRPLHRFLWSGLGAVALAFSFFLSALFLVKITDNYSRATFFSQLVAVAIAVLSVRALG